MTLLLLAAIYYPGAIGLLAVSFAGAGLMMAIHDLIEKRFRVKIPLSVFVCAAVGLPLCADIWIALHG